jgi:hypothetical protein
MQLWLMTLDDDTKKSNEPFACTKYRKEHLYAN